MDLVGFVITALLGGIVHVFLKAKRWADLTKFLLIRHVIISPIAGYVFWLMHTEYTFPNAVVVFIVGYSAASFLERLVERVKS